jgi:hypothetical protein
VSARNAVVGRNSREKHDDIWIRGLITWGEVKDSRKSCRRVIGLENVAGAKHSRRYSTAFARLSQRGVRRRSHKTTVVGGEVELRLRALDFSTVQKVSRESVCITVRSQFCAMAQRMG